MSDRQKIAMSQSEVTGFLTAHRKMQLATINRDGTPHLITMFYAVADERIVFWTYKSSQKALNMDRDPRVTCLVEDGDDYFELRGVQVRGTVRCVQDPEGVLEVGRLIAADLSGVPADGLDEFIKYTARKRFAYIIEPTRVSSWDHRKMMASG